MKIFPLLFALALVLPSVARALPQELIQDLPKRTALDDYVEKPDESYRWEIVSTSVNDGVKSIVVDMVSQSWLTEKEVNRTEWQHWLTLAVPEKVISDVGMLYIGGGSNRNDHPEKANATISAIAAATGTVVAELRMVPNQPLIFHGDAQPRTEDDLIGYTWNQYMETGRPVWLARNPMVKSAVRAMDAMTEVMASRPGGEVALNRFVVAGGSKRGWTTWLTGAVDKRVIAIAPIVIDVLNADLSMRHHFAAYGFWAPSIGNYVDHNIMQRMDDSRLADAYRLVDPYYYRHRLTMPKLVLNAAGDQFFLPDSSRFYFSELRGENYLRYVPNGDHGLGGTDAIESLIAFHTLMATDTKPPQFSWRNLEDGTVLVMVEDEPVEVRLWQATNPGARDFRMETLGPRYSSSVIAPQEDGLYRARVVPPSEGWTAFFVEVTFDVGAATALKLTTEVRVTPDELPFAGKAMDQPTSVTVVCTPKENTDVTTLLTERLPALVTMTGDLVSRNWNGRSYVNWTPAKGIYEATGEVQSLFKEHCTAVNYQLESGPEMTLPARAP
jgi:PhoPQ-activated pathogenicity-related protein